LLAGAVGVGEGVVEWLHLDIVLSSWLVCQQGSLVSRFPKRKGRQQSSIVMLLTDGLIRW